jgi:uncharacterized protein (DUF885 family)
MQSRVNTPRTMLARVLGIAALGAAVVLALGAPRALAANAAPRPPHSEGEQRGEAARAAFDRFAEGLAAEWMRANPMAATSVQYFSGEEQDGLDRELAALDSQNGMPLRSADLEVYVARAQHALEHLKRFPRAALSPVQRVSAAALEWQLDDTLRTARFADQRFVFEQFRGQQVALVNFMTQNHPMRTRRDVENYLTRLTQMAAVLDQGLEVARERAAKGTIPPKFILQATIDGIDRFLAPAPKDNVLVTSLGARSQAIKGLSSEDRAAAIEAAERTVATGVLPAFARVRALL